MGRAWIPAGGLLQRDGQLSFPVDGGVCGRVWRSHTTAAKTLALLAWPMLKTMGLFSGSQVFVFGARQTADRTIEPT